ncbi:MAG: hypothetical protein RLY47_423 [Candidatus Parcubacteria bacterium]
MLGTDAALLDPTSDASLRMKEYGALYSEVHIFTSAVDAERRGSVVLSDNVFVYPSKTSNKILALWSMFFRVYALMNKRAIRYVMAQDPFMLGLVAYKLTRFGRGRFAVGLYGTDPSNPFFQKESIKHRLYAIVAQFILLRANVIQTDGPETVERLRLAYGDKVFFKPMFPANMDVLSHGARSVLSTPFRLLFIGRFVPQKNLSLLIDVIDSLKKNAGNRIRITLVGDGPLKKWFIGELKRRGCFDICDDGGVVSREKIPELYATHHALILTSYYEGFPRVFMESAITGLPIITTDVGGVQDLIVDGVTGYVLPQGSSGEHISERVCTLVADPGLLASFSQNIREQWRRMYETKTVLDYQRPLVKFFETAISSNEGSGTLLRFLISGGTGFLVQVGLLYVLTEWFYLWYVLSGTLAFLFSQTTSFILQKLWTFKDFTRVRVHHQAVMFLCVGVLGIILNAALLYLFVDLLHVHYLFSQALSSALLAFLSFYIYSSRIFLKQSSK